MGLEMKVEHKNLGNYITYRISRQSRSKLEGVSALDCGNFGHGGNQEHSEVGLHYRAKLRRIVERLGAKKLARYDVWDPYDIGPARRVFVQLAPRYSESI